MEPIKPVENRREDGTFGPGNNANPEGRPKGKTIKERVREWLEDNPDDMKAFVEHFVKENKELAWQMLEGRPPQKTDVTSGGKRIALFDYVENRTNNSNKKDSGDGEKDSGGAGGNGGIEDDEYNSVSD